MTNYEWDSKGKTVSHLIRELLTFENQELEVRISLDGGDTSYPISLVGKSNNNYAVLANHQEEPTPVHHRILPSNMRGSEGNDV